MVLTMDLQITRLVFRILSLELSLYFIKRKLDGQYGTDSGSQDRMGQILQITMHQM